MATNGGPNIIEDGLVFAVDAANKKSYPGSGTSFNNLADSSNNFTINGSPTLNTLLDRFTFSSNQTTQYLEKSSYSFPANDYSISIWVKFTTTSFNGATVSYAYSTSQNNESLMYFANGELRFYGPTDNVNTNWNIPNTTSWFNLVRTRIKSSGAEKLYVNGSQEFSGTLNANVSSETPGTLIFGQEQDTVGGGFQSNQCFYGDFASMKLYNKNLSSTEVTQNYNALKGRFGL